MVDKAVFIGMTGAKTSMHQLEIVTNNLANANTTGFRADFEVMKQHTVSEKGEQSRVYAALDHTYTDFNKGPILNTGRDLDIAISGEGFFAVQAKDGREAYTRAGNLDINANGVLVTRSGEPILGNGGVINIPSAERVSIGADGTIAARLRGTKEMITINRLKLTNPAVKDLQKGADGLFYLSGESAPVLQSDKIELVSGSLEGSNVNTVETLTRLIDLSRNFEVHTNMMKSMEENSGKSNQLLELQR